MFDNLVFIPTFVYVFFFVFLMVKHLISVQ